MTCSQRQNKSNMPYELTHQAEALVEPLSGGRVYACRILNLFLSSLKYNPGLVPSGILDGLKKIQICLRDANQNLRTSPRRFLSSFLLFLLSFPPYFSHFPPFIPSFHLFFPTLHFLLSFLLYLLSFPPLISSLSYTAFPHFSPFHFIISIRAFTLITSSSLI